MSTVGSCAGQFTANTMAMMLAVASECLALARNAGCTLADLIRKGGPCPRDLVTRDSLANAAIAVAATGGSTNAALHPPAIANEAGIDFSLDDIAVIIDRIPFRADLKPGGNYWARDLHLAGGVPTLLRALLDTGLLHTH